MQLTRRGFLTGLLAAISAVMGGCAGARSDRGGTGKDAARLGCLFRHPAGAAQLGQSYLVMAANEADMAALVDLVAKDLQLTSGAIHQAPEDELRTALVRRIQIDFRRSNVVAINGWVLSVTEVRLCALVSLLPRCDGVAGT